MSFSSFSILGTSSSTHLLSQKFSSYYLLSTTFDLNLNYSFGQGICINLRSLHPHTKFKSLFLNKVCIHVFLGKYFYLMYLSYLRVDREFLYTLSFHKCHKMVVTRGIYEFLFSKQPSFNVE